MTDTTPETVPDAVVLDDERLQAMADLARQAREDAEWRASVTAALCGIGTSNADAGGIGITATSAEHAAREGRRALVDVRKHEERVELVDQLLDVHRLRDDVALYFSSGENPEGPVFTDPLARDVYRTLHP